MRCIRGSLKSADVTTKPNSVPEDALGLILAKGWLQISLFLWKMGNIEWHLGAKETWAKRLNTYWHNIVTDICAAIPMYSCLFYTALQYGSDRGLNFTLCRPMLHEYSIIYCFTQPMTSLTLQYLIPKDTIRWAVSYQPSIESYVFSIFSKRVAPLRYSSNIRACCLYSKLEGKKVELSLM